MSIAGSSIFGRDRKARWQEICGTHENIGIDRKYVNASNLIFNLCVEDGGSRVSSSSISGPGYGFGVRDDAGPVPLLDAVEGRSIS
ncbi:hypothetical protein [Nonomuraea sp. NPDC049400]|uniref:hypothetical protein n=1 Tax=Nonomuraea sp. NPDC049400 TaxID=3364352 RepID=UPI0037A1EC36